VNSWTSTVASWTADYYFLATLLILLTWVAMRFVRQPVRRLTIVWMTMAGLVVLAAICGMPNWPRVQILSLSESESLLNVSEAYEDYSTPQAESTPSRSVPSTMSEPSVEETGPDVPDEAILAEPLSTQSGTIDTQPALEDDSYLTLAEARSPNARKRWKEIIGGLFVAGVGFVSLWLAWGARKTLSLCRSADPVPDRITVALSRIVGKGHRVPRLLQSPSVSNAVALGVLRPTILLPSAMVTTDAKEGLEAVLAHEWAHIRNGDLWLLATIRFILLLLFANPLFWLLRTRVRLDQELVADATATEELGRDVYAAGLVAWARTGLGLAGRRIPAALAIHERPSWLEKRIAVLLDETLDIETSVARRWRYVWLVTLFAVVCLLSFLTIRPSVVQAKDPQEVSNNIAPFSDAETIAALEDVGAIVRRDESGRVLAIRLGTWVRESKNPLDLGHLPMLEEIELHDSDLTAEDLSRLENLATVQKLSLNGNQFTAAGVTLLKELPQLAELTLDGSAINDHSLTLLAGWSGLESLKLRDTAATEIGLSKLRTIPNLQHVHITNLTMKRSRPGHYQVTDFGVEQLAGIPNLKSLHLDFATHVTDSGAKHLRGLQKLERLDLAESPITDEGLRYLGTLPSLKRLFLSRTRITNAGLHHLKELNNLEELYISSSATFNIDGLTSLAKLPNLKGPWLSPIAFTDSELAKVSSSKQWTTIGLPRKNFTDAGMKYLGEMVGLERLSLNDSKITDTGMVNVRGLHRLTYLDLNNTQVGDDGLANIKGHTRLETLHLRNTRITDAGLAHLERLTALKDLSLDHTQITSAGLVHLEGITDLELLTLSSTKVDDVGLQSMKKLTRLRNLMLGDTEIGDTGLDHLVGLANLHDLGLGQTRITNEGIKVLRRLPSLRYLHLSNTKIDSASLEYLAGLPNLRSLNLTNTRVDDAGLANLKGMKTLTLLSLRGTDVTDAGLDHLKGLTRLRVLSLGSTDVTEVGIQSLKEALPGVSVRYDTPRIRSLGKGEIVRRHTQKAHEDGNATPSFRGNDLEETISLDNRPEVPVFVDRQAAITYLEGIGCRVSMRERESGTPVNRVSVSRGEQFDDRAMKCLGAFPDLGMLHLHRTKITDAGMEYLRQLTNLRHLSIGHAQVTDKGIAVVAQLTKLEDLDIGSTQVSDEGLKHLKTLRNLRQLSLPDTKVTDEGLARLKELASLERIALGLRGNVTDDGLRHLKDLPNLKSLQLSTDFTDAGLEHLATLTNLESLAILNCGGVTDEGVASLKGLTGLTSLSFMGIRLSDASMPCIGSLKELRSLHLESDAITDAGFAELSGLTKLERLEFWSLGITDNGLDALKGMNRLRSTTFARMRITDAGLQKLRECRTLERLTVLSCDVTSTGVEDLKKALPGLRVFHR